MIWEKAEKEEAEKDREKERYGAMWMGEQQQDLMYHHDQGIHP